MYNGWSNYETWLTNLHFDHFTSLFNDLTKEGIFDDMDNNEIKDWVANFIEQYVSDYVDESVGENSLFVTDMINGFMQDIDWQEIASHYVDDISVDVAVRNRELEAV
jgi:hypothetical protein